MANKKTEALIKCPFYLGEKNGMLMCEGCIKGTSMTTSFSDAAAKRRHLRENCFKVDGGACNLAKTVYLLYDEPRA